MPDNSGTDLQVTAAAAGWAMQEDSPQRSHNPIGAYICNLHILDSIQDSHQVTCMAIEDQHQADPTLSLVIARMWDGTLGQQQLKQNDPPKLNQFLQEQNHLQSWRGVLYRRARPRESEETLFQLVLPAAHRESTVRGCHDEVGHIGLEKTLDLMSGQFYWPSMAAKAKEQIHKCYPCLTFQARQSKAPLENIVAMHPLELIHLDYLCVEPGERPGRECFSGDRPLYPIYPSLCNTIPDHPNNSQSPLGQFHHPLWIAQKDPLRSGKNFWESAGGWSL